ncbi:Protein CBG21153 [Caenorhabditis briggsae]|uniref:Protein CBG21153 n=1 Tax=Caenorhabditis briggsae TaxID=6238 RepID=A8XZD1_CAEBR|nr:Protein CBG21153 [Caenorhabditis briggsae]CAP38058.1 Protein CBG21153 [Caenorhabditis briggsae]
MPSFVEIYDPKKRNEIIEQHIQMRKKQKNKDQEEHEELEKLEENRVEIFKPILDSNKKLQEEIIDEKNKIVETLNTFKNLKMSGERSLSEEKQLTIEPNKQAVSSPKTITVSNLIATYLQDDKDKSNAGYSLRYDKNNKSYTIGNKTVKFENNNIKINNVDYEATEGLMELLTKKSPNLVLISDYEKKSYQQILLCSDACYQGFDKNAPNKRLNSDPSDKWKFIREHYFTKSTSSVAEKSVTGSSIDFLPSNVNSLIDMLRLSIGSYKAGNKNEYNKIHRILDELKWILWIHNLIFKN